MTREPLNSHLFFAPFADKTWATDASSMPAAANAVNQPVDVGIVPRHGATPSGRQKSRCPAPIGFILRTKAAN